jgi:2-polyprenyl-6-methoxyphenol hydroxylase-like FAD-dependent oxidoreductase
LRLLESLASPSNLWRAPGIHAKTLEVLARHDLSDAFLKAGYPIDKMATLHRGQFITGSSMLCIRTEFPMVLACAQTNTERILRDKLDELHVPIHWSHKFVSYEFVDSYVSAQFKQTDAMGQEQLVTREFAYLVGCDGGHSQVRKAIGARFAGETRDHIITICDIESDANWLPAGW